jgi:hypothetical protein
MLTGVTGSDLRPGRKPVSHKTLERLEQTNAPALNEPATAGLCKDHTETRKEEI